MGFIENPLKFKRKINRNFNLNRLYQVSSMNFDFIETVRLTVLV